MSQETIVERLEEAGLGTDRFINVNRGQKDSYDHTQYPPSDVRGNYGIYTNADDALAIFDIDDYDDLEDKSGLHALAELPATLEQKSPHGGTHRLYRVETPDGRPIAEALDEYVGVENPNPSWGEIRVSNQYVVGAGSELDGCDKEWCDECATADGGQYEIGSDRAIATISQEELLRVLRDDPVYAQESRSDQTLNEATSSSMGTAEILSYALNDSDDEKLKSLWRGDYSGYNDRSSAECALAYKLGFWLQGDKRAVRAAMNGQNLPSDVPRPRLAKWEERDDDSYRDSVLEAVDEQSEYFEPSDGSDGASNSPEREDTDGGMWSSIRWLYQDPDVRTSRARQTAIEHLLEEHDFMTPRDTGTIWIYDDESGFYTSSGETEIETILARELERHYTQHERNEILGQIRARTYVDRSEFNADGNPDLVCVGNGVYNLDTGELLDHSPEYYFTRGVDTEYHPDAKADAIDTWLDEVVSRDADKQTLLEMVGAALSPRYEHGKFLILFGEGSNGKSTFFELVEALLGQENVSGWTLQNLSENRFANADLVGKFANVAPDMPGKRLQETGTLKTLTGGDQTMAERKGEDAFEFVNSATLMFGANRPPAIPEPSRAVKRRIVPIRFKQSFTAEDDDNPDKRNKQALMEELTTEEEMEGFLRMAIAGLERLRENGDVSLPESLDERLEYYEQFSDPIKEFRVNTLENAEGNRVKKSNVYDAYTAYCHENNYSPTSKSAFWRELGKTTLSIDESRPQIDGEQVRVINNVQFSEAGLQFAPESAQPDTPDDAEEESDSDTTPTPIAALDLGRHSDISAKIATVSDGEYTREAQGELKGPHGTYVSFVIPGGNENVASDYEGETVRIENAKLRTDDDGLRELVINDATTVTSVDDTQQTGFSSDSEAAADGGATTETVKSDTGPPEDAHGARAMAERIAEVLRTEGVTDRDSAESSASIAGFDAINMPPDDVERALDYGATQRGVFGRDEDGQYWVL